MLAVDDLAGEVGPGEPLDLEAVGRPEDGAADHGGREAGLGPAGVDDLDAVAQRFGQRLQRADQAVRRDLGRAPAHDAGHRGPGPDDGDPVERLTIQGQDAVVRHQHRRLGRRPPQQGQVVGGLRLRPVRRFWLVEDTEAVQRPELAAQRSVQVGRVDPTVGHRLHQRRAERPSRPRHLEVQPRAERGHRVDHGEPVGHDQALEPPFVTEEVDEQGGLLGEPPAVQPVVGRHDPEGAALLHRQLEGQQVELAEGALVDHRADRPALELGVVAHEVLHRGEHAVGLDAPHVARGQPPREQWILRVALEVAPGEGVTVEVDRRGEQATTTPVEGLAADQRSELLRQFRVPGRPDGRTAGDAGRRGAAHAGQIGPAGPVRTVGDVDPRDAEALDGGRGEQVAAGREGCLLVESQLLEERVDVRQGQTTGSPVDSVATAPLRAMARSSVPR